MAFAAIPASGRPWARIVSCNPCEVKDDLVPPVFSGYPTDDTAEWPAFWAEYDRVLGTQIAGFDAWLREHGGPGLPSARDFMYESPFLNLYLFPEATDYRRATPLPPTWHRLDSSVRTDAAFDVDAALARRRADRLPVARLARLGRRRADAALDRRAREDRLPRDRQQGSAARAAHAGRQHVRRGVPAAAVDPAAGRRGHHARRQQHRDRVLPLREADGRAPAVLGSVRQRAAGRRAGTTACAWTRTGSRTSS